MTMTTTQLPSWLNPAAMPPDELVERIRAAADAFTEIEECMDSFVADHVAALIEYRSQSQGRNLGANFPDEVLDAIDELTGYGDLHTRIMILEERLTRAANKRSIGSDATTEVGE